MKNKIKDQIMGNMKILVAKSLNNAIRISAKYSKRKMLSYFRLDVPAKTGLKTLKIEVSSLKKMLSKCMKIFKSLISFETLNFVIKSKLFPLYFLLISIGFLMIYSSTVPFDNSDRYLIKQLFIISLSLLSLFCIVNIPISFYKKNSRILILIAIFMLGILLIPGVGREVNGSQRWFSIPGFSFQPSELVKLLIIFYASDYVTRKLSVKNKIKESFFADNVSFINNICFSATTTRLWSLCGYNFNYIWNFFLEALILNKSY